MAIRTHTWVIVTLLVLTLLITACIPQNNMPVKEGFPEITIYKSPSCGCCVGYATALKDEGYKVNIVEVDDLSAVKEKYGIPKEMESCHTSIVGRYFVEGHVPFEALEKLIVEQPSIDGIALPRMPSGTPGMPGPKRAPYIIYSLTNGEITEYVRI